MNKMITKKEFKKEVIEKSGLSLVLFETEWNGACQIVASIYEELANTYKSHVSFFTTDTEEEKGIGDEYGVTDVPAILFFLAGKAIDSITGLAPKHLMIGKIETALSLQTVKN